MQNFISRFIYDHKGSLLAFDINRMLYTIFPIIPIIYVLFCRFSRALFGKLYWLFTLFIYKDYIFCTFESYLKVTVQRSFPAGNSYIHQNLLTWHLFPYIIFVTSNSIIYNIATAAYNSRYIIRTATLKYGQETGNDELCFAGFTHVWKCFV